MTGKVIELFITKDDVKKTRISVASIRVDEDGIKGDKFYAKDSMRAILLSSQDSYKLSKENAIDLNTGALGENILIDINPYSLVHGDRIKIGNTELEITQNCTLCKGLSTLNSKLPKLLKNDRGIFAKVIEGSSEIHLDDKVEILSY
jgi:MOSC domain-containing protein YiiM